MMTNSLPDWRRRTYAALVALPLLLATVAPATADPVFWRFAWPNTDFATYAVPLEEIFSGGVPRDGIPPIYAPRFAPVADVEGLYKGTEPVITVALDGTARAYPLGILMAHEIVNDTLAGRPIAVAYCPLCNSAVVFDRRLGGRTLTFGVCGMLRHSDLVMWDHETESWWQQFTGAAIVGELTGSELTMLPVRVESFAKFRARFPSGEVLLNPRGGPGVNPYAGYDSSEQAFVYRGTFPAGIRPLDYVVAVGDRAWALSLLQDRRRVEADGLVIIWEPGQNAAMDARDIHAGSDIGNVTVQRRVGGVLVDVVHDVTFAFAFHAFHPDGAIHK